jgi:glycosyltransferase involved in cell wall biosynthesis
MGKPWPVLLVVRELGIGGCERDLTKIAAGLDRSRFNPFVACFRPEGLRSDELRAAGVPVLELPVRSFRNWTVLNGAASLQRYLRRHRIRLVHAWDVPAGLFAIPLARLFRVPYLIFSQLSYRELVGGATMFLLRRIDRLSHRIHVNCEAMRRYMIEHEGAPPERLFLCHNGVDTRIFHNHGRLRPEILRQASLVIGTVAALRPEKRIDLLLRAFAALSPDPGVKLVIVGSGPLRLSLERLAGELGVGGNCVFIPTTRDVASWMRAIDIFVLPSDSEAFSNALLEAMACGCCPVGSEVGGMPELIAHGRHGFLFPRGEAESLSAHLKCLAENHELRKRFAVQAAAYARENFPIEKTLNRMESLYQTLLSQGDSA